MNTMIIFHVDMDAFFASVEQRDNPSLRGKPVIIGADPKDGKGRGVVSTCSYEARKFGVHSAMPISQAWRRCPGGVYVRPDMLRYHKASEDVFDVFQRFTPDIEPLSIDEAFLDMTGSCHLFGSPLDAGRRLRKEMLTSTGLTASVGIAPVKSVAKIASDECKPDGLLEVLPHDLLSFLHPLSVEKLWGAGPKTCERLKAMGLRTIGDVARSDPGQLQKVFGMQGPHLHALANGWDDRRVEADDEIKSVSHEETFEHDTDDQRLIFDTLLSLSEQVSSRLRRYGLKGRLVTLKVRLSNFKTSTHCQRLAERSNFEDVIFKTAKTLFLDHYGLEDGVRLVGVRVSDFDDGYVCDDLFAPSASRRQEAVHSALDTVRARFGKDAIHRAGGGKDRS